MRKAAGLVLSLALLGVPPAAVAQANFSGAWELVEGIPDTPLFREGRIEQSAERLIIAPSPPNRLFEEPRVLRLDGAESLYTHKNVRGDETWVLASRARWVDASLQITTVTTRSGALIGRWESLMTISVDDKGQLVIVRNEPTVQGTTATLRSVYRRK